MRDIDLNLLHLLDLLVSECHVTRAAERANLSQPAMSAALKRLRDYYRDPLLLRTPRGMEPTRKAKEIVTPIRAALAQIRHANTSGSEPVDPRTVEKTFTIGTSEYGSLVVMPSLCREIDRLKAKLSISMVELEKDPLEPLRSGAVDIVIAAGPTETTSIRRRRLFTDRYVCIARDGHPDIAGRITMKQFIDASHIRVRQRMGGKTGIVDSMFHDIGKVRRCAITLADFLAVPHIIADTDHVMTVAARVAQSLEKRFPIQIVPHPLRKDHFEICQFWHQRMDSDPVHAWMRNLIERVSRNLGDTRGRHLARKS